ncbi:c-type cytochrome, partial [Haloferula sp.]|uniref:c-type cytochrome n=1 Tax=Haloferula sp. TaxID=2497595 RepID=UPI003C7881E7
MEPTRDNPLVRFSAFWWGIGVISLFGVLLLILWLRSGGNSGIEPLEQAAAIKRYEIRASVDAAQAANLDWKVVDEGSAVQVPPEVVFETLGEQLIASTPSKVDDPAQVIPNSPTSEKLAAGPSADYAAVDNMTPPAGTAPDPAVMEEGKLAYLICSACHGANGEGGPIAPPLAGSDWVTGPVSNLIRIQLRGLTGPITVSGVEYNFPAPMAPLAVQTDDQIAAVLTYVRNPFGNSAAPVLPAQVEALRS